MTFPYKTPPFEHQRKALRLTAHKRAAGLFIRPGYGKSKIIADNAADLFLQHKIDCLIVTAPNIVHENWLDQLETHMPLPAWDEATVYVWRADAAAQAETYAKDRKIKPIWDVMIEEEPFPILLMNIDAVMTKLGAKVLRKFLDHRKAMWVEDESSDIATPNAKRTKRVRALGPRAAYRRILDGNPTDEAPLHLYAPMAFLDPKIIGCPTHAAFKEEYAEWDDLRLHEGSPNERVVKVIRKRFDATGDLVPVYKNLDQLARKVGTACYVMTDADAAIGMPPRTYGTMLVDLNAAQREMYEDLRRTNVAMFDDGATTSASNALVRDLRLQQIVCGYIPIDPNWMWGGDIDAAPEPTRIIPGGADARLGALWEGFEKYPGKAIVWGRFHLDLDLIEERLRARRIRYVRLDGTTTGDRLALVDEFQEDPSCRVFLSNARVAGRGITLTRGLNMYFYSNYFGARLREQAERRAWRIGVEGPVWVNDLIARRTIDVKLVADVATKRRISAAFTKMIADVNA